MWFCDKMWDEPRVHVLKISGLTNTLGEVTSQNLWSRYDRHAVGITWYDVRS